MVFGEASHPVDVATSICLFAFGDGDYILKCRDRKQCCTYSFYNWYCFNSFLSDVSLRNSGTKLHEPCSTNHAPRTMYSEGLLSQGQKQLMPLHLQR